MEKTKKIEKYNTQLKDLGEDIDQNLLFKITTYLGPSIYNADAELVSCGDEKELETVKHNFLKIKLGLEELSEDKLDKAIMEVRDKLKNHGRKNRAVFYYLLTKKFRKESIFE
ncbi:MAG: DUF2853 family protein [Candidatus Woesearchaeota archaeon]|nr:DUF2853 family protein [Candidatus Woesearchaeota archaeon]